MSEHETNEQARPDGAASTTAATSESESPSKAAPTSSKLSAELEREIDDAMKAMEKEEAAHAPASKPAIRGPRVIEAGRERRHGRVVSVGPSDIFIEFGPKELGVAPRSQWSDDELPKVDGDLEVIVDRFDSNENLYLCSKPGAVQKAEWELLEPGQVVEARVSGVNKGGLQLEIAQHDAFMPASLVDTHHIDDLSVFVGEKVKCKVERIDRSGRGRIVLNRRAVLSEERKELRNTLKEKLEVGATVKGAVRKIMPFGAFIDIGGVDGLLHISDLSHGRVDKVEDVVKEGDELELQVLKLEWGKNRISLGLKQLQADPYETAAEQFPPESITGGKVTRTTQFGAFVELAPGVEGLVHISELDWKRVRKVEDVLNVGQSVKVKVISFDPEKQRISLSVKQTTKPPAGAEGESARSVEEIRKETPQQRRMREEFKRRQKEEEESGLKGGGFGDGLGLGDLKL